MQSKNQIPIVDLFKFTEGMCGLFINGGEVLPCLKLNLLEFNCRLYPLSNSNTTQFIYGDYNDKSV